MGGTDIVGAVGGLFNNPNQADLTILLTRTLSDGHYHLAVARFYDSAACGMDETSVRALYYDVLEEVKQQNKTNAFDRVRKHSGGPAIKNQNAYKAFFHANAFPRHITSVHFIPRGDEWTCVYIAPPTEPNQSERAVRTWNGYSQPQPGGNIEISPELYSKYDFFGKFTKAKLRCAQIVRQLEQLVPGVASISHNACSESFAQLGRAREALGAACDERALLCLVSSYNCYTLVCYSVAYHQVIMH